MSDLPPTSINSPTDPDEPGGTGRHDGMPTPIHPPGGFPSIDAGAVIGGRYKLVKELGEGGMGAVWMAEQSEPVRRLVAVKLIRTGMDSREFLARFEAERQALSLMDHPNIAKVFDAGTLPDSRPYFVMELVRGTPITKFCDEKRLTARQRLELFVPVCNAIQHAHQKGIIHRDIKPNNVLVAVHDDKPVPKVIDFGVAKATGQPLSEKTMHTLGIVGTPEYMSPEQATENQLDIDTRSDVYSLGVLLYELLTGTTPVKASGLKQKVLLEILRVVREVEAPRPSTYLSASDTSPGVAAVRGTEPARLTKELRGEIDWIAMKALEKDRARRYETTNGFAMDLQRYLAGEPVLAHPPSVSYRMRKFVRKHRGPVIAASLILLTLIGGLIGTAYGLIEAGKQKEAKARQEQAERDRDVAEAARDRENFARNAAEKARDGERLAREDLAKEQEKLARVEYGRTIQVAYDRWRDNDLIVARVLLEGTRTDLRGWEWHYVHRLCHADLLTLNLPNGYVDSASFSADGARIVMGSDKNAAKVWDARTGAELLILKGHSDHIMSTSFSVDGLLIVTASQDKTAKVWDARTGAELFTLKGHSASVQSASFNTNGLRILTASQDSTAKVWDAKTGAELVTFKGHSPIFSASFSSDGSRIVTGSSDKTAKVWDAKSGGELLTLKGHTGCLSSASFSTDGLRIVTACGSSPKNLPELQDKTAKVWDATTGAELLTLKGHTDDVMSASFSPDGSRIVTGGQDNTVKVWDAKTGFELLTLKGHTGAVLSASFSRDGSRIVTQSDDRSVKVWDATVRAEHLTLKGRENSINCASFSPDGSRIVTGNEGSIASVRDVKTGAELLTLEGQHGLACASFSADGTRIVSGYWDGIAKVWDTKTRAEVLSLKAHTGMVGSASFSPDGLRIITGSGIFNGIEGDTAKVWDVKTGTNLLTLKGCIASFSPDGLRIVTGGRDNTTRVWDATRGAELLTLKGHTGIVNSASFSSDASRIITSSQDGTARVWDSKSGAELLTLTGLADLASLSADGTRIVTAGHDGTVQVWDAQTGAELLTFKGHTDIICSVSFSSDGSRIVTASQDGKAKIWDSRSINRDFLPRELAPPPRPSPDTDR